MLAAGFRKGTLLAGRLLLRRIGGYAGPFEDGTWYHYELSLTASQTILKVYEWTSSNPACWRWAAWR